MFKTDGFDVDAESFSLVRAEVGFGVIRELRPPDAGLLARHLGNHPETLAMPCSGVCPPSDLGPFRAGEPLVAVEWVREERKPIAGEPECNAYRYLFGMTRDGTCRGYEVTVEKGGPTTGQVADHWMDLNTTAKRFDSMEPL
jgi:hypothetical protein